MTKLATINKPEVPSKQNSDSAFDNMPTGLENLTARDLIIPRLVILQGLSPQVTQGNQKYDHEAKVGDIYDVSLQERFNDGIEFIPVKYMKQWLEWAPRQSGKGLIKIHDDESIMDEAERDEGSGRRILPNGNYVIETAQFFGLNASANFRRSFLPMSSTQLKKARFLLTKASEVKANRPDGSTFTPPMFYMTYHLTTIPESNNQGNWIGWKVEFGRPIKTMGENWNAILEECLTFRASLDKGELKGDVSDFADDHARSEQPL